MAALKSVPCHTVKNCWVACKILTMQQMLELETGDRHNYRSKSNAAAAAGGVSQQDIDELSAMLSKLGKSLAQDGHDAVKMIEAVDLIDMELERDVFDPPSGEVDMSEEDDEPMGVLDSEEHAIILREVGDVDDKEPPPPLTLTHFRPKIYQRGCLHL